MKWVSTCPVDDSAICCQREGLFDSRLSCHTCTGFHSARVCTQDEEASSLNLKTESNGVKVQSCFCDWFKVSVFVCALPVGLSVCLSNMELNMIYCVLLKSPVVCVCV